MPETVAAPIARQSLAQLGTTPLFPKGKACFPSTGQSDVKALYEELLATYTQLSDEVPDHPFSNPILRLAVTISRRFARGMLSFSDVEQLIQYLSADGFLRRGACQAAYLGELDPEANIARLRARFRTLALPDGATAPVTFERFRRSVEQEVFGIVITAHPTFNLSGDLMHALAAVTTGRNAEGKPLTAEDHRSLVDTILHSEHRPDEDISLAREHELSMEAIGNIQKALRRVYALVIEVGREFYGDKADALTPRLITIASWVGYDLDGRSDIRWSDMLHKRLRIQAVQLRSYLDEVRDIRSLGAGHEDLRNTMDLLESRLALALNEVTDQLGVFENADPASTNGFEAVRRISKRMFENRELSLVDAAPLVEKVQAASRHLEGADAQNASELRGRLATLRAELSNYGLGMAHTHVRINSTQVHNAIRKRVGLDGTPEDPRFRQTLMNAVSELLDKVEPVSINFGSLVAENTSAKRLFMVVAQMLKYIDGSQPVRFLIAECESAFTLLTALYYARLFGVDDRLDISPLFETENALRDGSKLIDQLLENPHYRAYVEKRGRLCVQTGFSDAGRYLGQTVACASIERLRGRLWRVMQKHGLKGVQLVMFDTHGESIGRGRHPVSFPERLSYIATPTVLAEIAEAGIPYKQEVSFQGGDGYQYFVTEDGALAVVTQILDYILAPKKVEPDPFYDNGDYIREFFTTVKAFQDSLMEDANYGAVLSAFGTNMLWPSGSRSVKRQHDNTGEKIDFAHPRQLRAIPHNATLIQLGLTANCISGVGEAIERDPEHFIELYNTSTRFRQLMGIVEYGFAISNCEALGAYVETLNPDHWLSRSAHARNLNRAEAMRRLSGHLEKSGLYERQLGIYRRLHLDYIKLRDGLARAHGEKAGGAGALVEPEARAQLAIQHALRIALIHELYLLAMQVPEFSSQHGITLSSLIARTLHLDIQSVVAQLQQIFPALVDATASIDFGERATYVSDDTQSYNQENLKLFAPMKGLYALIRRLTTANMHIAGFLG
jgi:phosphoenolpyruvate carboxylase